MNQPGVALAIIGGGNMARAILTGGRGGIGPIHDGLVVVAEPDASKHEALRDLGVEVTPTAYEAVVRLLNAEPAPGTGQVLLAVKPQMLAAVAGEIAPLLVQPRVVISILAGTPTAKIRAALGGRVRMVRAMPNLAARVRQGATAVCMGEGAAPGDDDLARAIFRDVGPLVVSIDERMMDAFTAVAGSGPAYVFYLAEAMVKAGIELGFDAKTASDIVRETIAGAGALLAESLEEPASLRAAVTSKGGTTAAAAAVLDQRGVMEGIVSAIIAARDRGAELAGPA